MTDTRNPTSGLRNTYLAIAALASVLGGCETQPSDPVEAAQAALDAGSPRIAMEHLNAAIAADPDNAELRLLAGDLAIALGNPDRAVSEFERVVNGAEASSLARAKLAEAYLLGNYMGAAKEALGTLEFDVPMAYTAAIGIDMASGDIAPAYEKLDEGLSKFPDDPRLLTIDAERHWAMARPAKARESLARALAASPTVPHAHLLAGQIALAERSLDDAQSHFEKVLAVHPAQQAAMLAMAAIARDRGDDAKAAEWIDRTGGTGSTHPIGVLFLAQMAYDAGDIQQAYEIIETVPPIIASEPAFARLRGFIDAGRKQHGAAILALKDYAAEHAADLNAQRVLAQSYAAEGEFANAWDVIEPVVDHPQADTGLLSFALRVAERSGRADTAGLRAKIAARNSQADISAKMVEAGAAIRAGNWATADAIYAPLVAGPGADDAALLNNAAAVKSKLGQHDAAVALARRALAKAPQSPQIMDTLGWALWQQGTRKREARALLTRARESAPDSQEIARHWAAAHAE